MPIRYPALPRTYTRPPRMSTQHIPRVARHHNQPVIHGIGHAILHIPGAEDSQPAHERRQVIPGYPLNSQRAGALDSAADVPVAADVQQIYRRLALSQRRLDLLVQGPVAQTRSINGHTSIPGPSTLYRRYSWAETAAQLPADQLFLEIANVHPSRISPVMMPARSISPTKIAPRSFLHGGRCTDNSCHPARCTPVPPPPSGGQSGPRR